jgi:hypothetical protein
VRAVDERDVTLLTHTGNVSVQLQPPGTATETTGPEDVEEPDE